MLIDLQPTSHVIILMILVTIVKGFVPPVRKQQEMCGSRFEIFWQII